MPDNDQRIYVIRHGETQWSLSGQHTGVTDIPLTENGRNQARLLQPLLANESFALVLTSPLQRAKDTCTLSGLSDGAEVDPDLMEWNYGDYEGITTKQIHAQAPGWLIFNDGAPQGESPEQVGSRADRIIAKIQSVQGDVALFAHGHIFRVLVARWLDLPPQAGRNFLLDTGTLNILGYYRGHPAVKTWNAPILR